MLTTRVIPCLDVDKGRVVKGVNFTNLVDENRDILYDLVQRTAEVCFMPLTIGGGVRNLEDIRKLLLAGADKVSINTQAVQNPEIVKDAAEKFGNQCIVVAIDARKVKNGKWEIFTHGGRNATGLDALDWSRKVSQLGAGEILLTSMDRDGTKDGFDLELTKMVSDSIPIPVVASGGVGNLDHLVEGIVHGHASAVLAASIFHFGIHTIVEAKEFMKRKGIPVRLEVNGMGT